MILTVRHFSSKSIRMSLFYIRHHFQSIVRSKSFGGEVFAFFIIAILLVSSVPFTFSLLDQYAESVSAFFSQTETNYYLFLVVYLFGDLAIRLVFRRPLPKLKYYMLWKNSSGQIAGQYLFTSFFGIMPFVLMISMIMIVLKASEWLGSTVMIAMLLWWVSNHFLGLVAQFTDRSAKIGLSLVVLLVLASQWLFPSFKFFQYLLTPEFAVALLVLTGFLSFYLVMRSIEKREIDSSQGQSGFLESLPALSFKNPVFQLEWALIVRNKRTRSNLLLGLVSVLIFPFLIDGDTEWMVGILIFFITTGFFIIQHGVYSLGWEGSYFDFLITNISPKDFVKTRYIFYVGTCVVGLGLASIPTIINGLSWVNLFMIFIYNIGVTIPLVLFRSTLNSTKIVLTENSFMNYNGMLTGPIFVSSFLVVLLPIFIYAIGQAFMQESAFYLLGLLGFAGLLLYNPITNRIAKTYRLRKYHLSQSFKA